MILSRFSRLRAPFLGLTSPRRSCTFFPLNHEVTPFKFKFENMSGTLRIVSPFYLAPLLDDRTSFRDYVVHPWIHPVTGF